MIITGHFIDANWNLHRRILSFSTITSHKADMIGKQLEDCLLEWGIDRVFTITVDNVTANDAAINYLKKKLKGWREDSMVLDGEFLHVRCSAHILNLIVSDGLKEMHDSIVCIRNAIKYVRSHTLRMQSFTNSVEREKIEYKGTVVLDVATRWNSTYLMLATALKFRRAFDRMAEEDGLYVNYFLEEESGKKIDGPPTSMDWENAEKFARFLKTFYDVTNKFSASLSTTSNICFPEICTVNKVLSELCQSADYWVASMANRMKA